MHPQIVQQSVRALAAEALPRRVVFDAFGAPGVLRVTPADLPEPGPGEVRVRVEASSVQFTDTLIRRGLYPDLKQKPPLTPGYDFVGRVDAVGEGVSDWQVGDRVADLCVIGGNATHVVRPAASLVPVPEEVDAAEATSLVLSWTTAQQGLFRAGRLARGERLLVIGANGAVGEAAVALGVAAGATVFASAAEIHHDRLRAAGAHPVSRDDWLPEILEAGGADVVLDGVCADGFVSPLRSLRAGGRLVAIGFSAPASKGTLRAAVPGFLRLQLRKLWPDSKRTAFYSITDARTKDPEAFREDLGALLSALSRGEIRPHVARRLGFDEVPAVHAALEAGGLEGKHVLVPRA